MDRDIGGTVLASHADREDWLSAKVIDGKMFAERLAGRLKAALSDFSAQVGRKPGLAVVVAGCDPASEIYVRSKVWMAGELP